MKGVAGRMKPPIQGGRNSMIRVANNKPVRASFLWWDMTRCTSGGAGLNVR